MEEDEQEPSSFRSRCCTSLIPSLSHEAHTTRSLDARCIEHWISLSLAPPLIPISHTRIHSHASHSLALTHTLASARTLFSDLVLLSYDLHITTFEALAAYAYELLMTTP